MTDHFEKTMADIAVKRTGNGGPKIEDVLEALRATNEDADETAAALAKTVETTHRETRRWHEEVKAMVAEHILEAAERDRRITNLELAEADRRQKCIPLVRNIAKELHDQTHAEYVASLEPDNRSFAQILAAWSAGKKALAIIATALLIGLTGIGVSYIGSFFANNKADSAIIHDQGTPTPRPTVTVTVLPTTGATP